MPAAAVTRVLVTGFEAFGGDAVNPAGEVAQALHGCVLHDLQIAGVVLPCAFGQALAALDEALASVQPSLVLALGVAARRSAFTPERVAINLDDARIADNLGTMPLDRPVVAGGPAAYFSTLPVKAMVAAIRQSTGLDAEVSHSAGSFVCNHVFYGLMHRLHTQPALAGVRGGFMHLPPLPGQVSAAATPVGRCADLPGQRAAVVAALHAMGAHAQDLPLVGGSVD